MDLLSQHEAFLRAIFDNPEDDTARLVYADFLQENGEEDRAEFVRLQLQLPEIEKAHIDAFYTHVDEPTNADKLERYHEAQSRLKDVNERFSLVTQVVVPWRELTHPGSVVTSRDFWFDQTTEGVAISGKELDHPQKFREWVVRVNPAWYGETKLYVRPGSSLQSSHIHTLYGLPFAQQVTEWNLNGHLVEYEPEPPGDFIPLDYPAYRAGDMVIKPVITQSALDGLTRHRGARRIRKLDLRNNHLGSDAARLLVKSPYLENLNKLRLLEGNSLRGKVWQEVLEHFGEDVVE